MRTAGIGVGAPQSYLRINYTDRKQPSGPSDRLGPVDAPLGSEPLPVASAWPPLATTGASFGEGYNDEIAGFAVEAGSRLLAPLISQPLGGCAADAYVAILAVEGKPADVLAAYARQAGEHVGGESYASTGEPLRVANGSILTDAYAAAPGGDSYNLRLVEPASGAPLLQITTCYD